MAGGKNIQADANGSSTFKNLALVGFVAAAAYTNPNEASFKRYLETQMKADGADKVSSKVVSFVASSVSKRQNFLLFSIMSVAADDGCYVGMFGRGVRGGGATFDGV
eukprot:comp10175_c1_seq1/m.5009 comp10175_c1_seq1/g.5009  ORF comp10175_c1_seq1/g.5009 comp10175_c1_seq1/m.5009 type:complete len:107 (-) comp10175_c1_seq1:2-322(-)